MNKAQRSLQDLLIIKIGGNILDDAQRLQSFLTDFAALAGPKILVHGGGKIASAIGQQLGIAPQLVDGRRITDAATLNLVTMVYGGLVNKQVVAGLQAAGCNALGVTGADGNLIVAHKRPVATIDYGFVGDIAGAASINAVALQALLAQQFTPVFAPLTHDGQGNLLNTNADTIASVLATALAPLYRVKLIYCFEKSGVLQNTADDASVISEINTAKYKKLKSNGTITQGMIPKMDNAFAALSQGVHSVQIGDADAIQQLVTGNATGTLLTL